MLRGSIACANHERGAVRSRSLINAMIPFVWSTRHEDSPESPRRNERTQFREPRADPRSIYDIHTI